MKCSSTNNNMDQAVASIPSGDTDSYSETIAMDMSSTTSLEEICLTSLNSNRNSVSCNSGDPSSCFETLVAVSTSVDDSSYQPSLNVTNLEAPTFAQVDISYALPAVIDNIYSSSFDHDYTLASMNSLDARTDSVEYRTVKLVMISFRIKLS